MKKTFLLALVLCISLYIFPQSNGSFFTLKLAKKTCLFKYEEIPDTIWVDIDSSYKKNLKPNRVKHYSAITNNETRDSIVTNKFLTLQDNNKKSIHTKAPVDIDTVVALNPVTLAEEIKITPVNDTYYHIETEMSYFDFLLLLKSKFELRNPQKNLRVYSYNIYYETPTEAGMIRISYPDIAEGVITKLNCLSKEGGFILLSLRAADHNKISIDGGGTFLALIHIKN